MEYRNQDDDIGIPSSSLGYNSPPPPQPSLRGSAFSRPTLPPSSSLISQRVGGGGGGSCAGGAVISSGAAGTRNGSIFSNNTPSAAVPSATATGTSVNILRSAPASVENFSSQSHGKAPDPVPISSLSPSSLAAGVVSSNSKAAISTAAPKVSTAAVTTTDAAATVVDASHRYRECLRNHAASIGGHVVDGCGEFMPNGEPSTAEALKCAACGCHRSFHRKEAEGDSNAGANSYYRAAGAARLPFLLPPPHPQVVHHPHNPHTPKQFQLSGFSSSPSPVVAGSLGVVAFGGNTSGSGGTTTESSSEELIHSGAPTPTTTAPRKRFRTKFTPEQKEKMLAFADRVGWRFQKQDEAAIEQFCGEVGIRRQVLKVWMHNNKHTTKKQQQLPSEQEEQLMAQQQQQQQQQ